MYRKQFKIPEAHQNFIEQSLDEWLKLGVVKRANSLYNSPIFCVPKKQGQGLRVVQDFRELNNHSHIDKYSMKEITECIGDIGRANSTIFSTLDLTSGFWQMQLDEVTATHGFHHSRTRPISVDNFTDGSTWMSGQFSKAHGRSITQHLQRHSLH